MDKNRSLSMNETNPKENGKEVFLADKASQAKPGYKTEDRSQKENSIYACELFVRFEKRCEVCMACLKADAKCEIRDCET